ncbi:MAG: hypothetical protein R3F19_32095 [Verrucomicrobiales bacterium]
MKAAITSKDVGKAAVAFASSTFLKTTGAQIPVVALAGGHRKGIRMTNRSIGEAVEFGRGSQASASTNFYPDTWRYLRFEYEFLDRYLLCFPIIGILSVLLGLALLKVHVALTILVVVTLS